jgi:hypothetical protein
MPAFTRKSFLKIFLAGILVCVVFICFLWLLGSTDETPNDIHQKLVPQIAQELIDHHDSSRVAGLTPEIKAALEKYPAEDVTFTIGASDLHGETGISFYTKQDHKRFLALGLDLNAKEDGYILSGVSQIDPQ